MRKHRHAHDGVEIASAGDYRVYRVANADGRVVYELAGLDGENLPVVLGDMHEAMAAMTAVLARPIAERGLGRHQRRCA